MGHSQSHPLQRFRINNKNKNKKTNKHSKSKPIYDPSKHPCREATAAWNREGIAVTDVYNVMEVLGEGHMGKVTAIVRKSQKSEEIKLEKSNSKNDDDGKSRKLRYIMIRKRRRRRRVDTGRRPILRDARENDFLPTTNKDDILKIATETKNKEQEQKNTNQKRRYACKTVSANHQKMTQEEWCELLNEVDIMRTLNHPNILELFEVYHTYQKIWIVTELCTGGDLFTRINKNNHNKSSNNNNNNRDVKNSEYKVASIILQVCRAVSYMHNNLVCHRDIKLENILYEHPENDNDNDDDTIKLIDFGLSRKYTNHRLMYTMCGTLYSVAPEVLRGEGYTELVDVWSLGIVALILLSNDATLPKNKEFVRDPCVDWIPDATTMISNHGRKFVRRCLRKNYTDNRWTSSEALSFIQNQWIPSLKTTTTNRNSHNISMDDWTASTTTADARLNVFTNQQTNDPGSIYFPSDCTLVQTWGDMDRFRSCHRQKSCLMRPTSSNATTFSRLTSSVSSFLQKKISMTHRSKTRMNTILFHGIESFATYGALKKTLLLVMVRIMDKQTVDVKRGRDLFLSLDLDNDGTVGPCDLKCALSPKTMSKICANDNNNNNSKKECMEDDGEWDGNINFLHYDEFLAAIASCEGLITKERLEETYARIDVEGKGFINKDDLKEILGSDYEENTVISMLDEADCNEDGVIDHEEFLQFMLFQ